MTWLVSIDESGSLGRDSHFFVMAAVVVMRPRTLLNVAKQIPKLYFESKFYNSTREEITNVLRTLSKCDVRIVYVVADKYDYTGQYYGTYGNDLYKMILQDLLAKAFSLVNKGDVNVFLDRSSFVSLTSFRTIAGEVASSAGCNLKQCDKVTSHQNKCIQIADYVVGAINRNYEDGNSYYMDIIRSKISVACRN